MNVDLCHVSGCNELAVDIQWCPGLLMCIQVCKDHAFDTLPPETDIDLDRAARDYVRNSHLFNKAIKQ